MFLEQINRIDIRDALNRLDVVDHHLTLGRYAITDNFWNSRISPETLTGWCITIEVFGFPLDLYIPSRIDRISILSSNPLKLFGIDDWVDPIVECDLGNEIKPLLVKTVDRFIDSKSKSRFRIAAMDKIRSGPHQAPDRFNYGIESVISPIEQDILNVLLTLIDFEQPGAWIDAAEPRFGKRLWFKDEFNNFYSVTPYSFYIQRPAVTKFDKFGFVSGYGEIMVDNHEL